jgi:hypothetical protein
VPLIGRVDPNVWLVIGFSLFAVMPLAGPGYFFEAHDAPHTIFFLTEFDAALRDGVWYPGWATDQALGYGYPTFVLYPPLAYYVAEGFHLLGAGKVAAIKWTWALATVGAGLAMYAYARHILGRHSGLLAAVVYVYTPYHLADLYVRAALAEYSAFAWMPLALLAFHTLTGRPSETSRAPRTAQSLALAGLAYGALWLTHNPTGLAFTLLLAAYVLFRLATEGTSWSWVLRRALASLVGGLLGLGIAAALILPNLFERGFINQTQWVRASYNYALHFVYPFQFLSPFWGYGAAGPGPIDGMSFQLGVLPVLLGGAALIGALWRPGRKRALAFFYGLATLLILFLMIPTSAPLWEVLPLAALVQFPWRLLALTTVTLAVLSGLALNRVSISGRRGPGLILVLVVVLGSFPYTLPEYTPVPEIAEGPLLTIEFERTYRDMVGMTAWTEELPPDSPLVEQYRAGGPLITAEASAPEATIEMIRTGGASDELWVRSPEGTELTFYTYYFPGWRVFVDGERVPDSALRPKPPYGLLTLDLPPGEHRVLLRWGDTPLRMAGKGLTVTCLALALGLVVWSWRRGSAAG